MQFAKSYIDMILMKWKKLEVRNICNYILVIEINTFYNNFCLILCVCARAHVYMYTHTHIYIQIHRSLTDPWTHTASVISELTNAGLL